MSENLIFTKTDLENRKENFLLGKAVFFFGKTKVDFAKLDVGNRKQDFLLGKEDLLLGKTKVDFAKRDAGNRKQDFLLVKCALLPGLIKVEIGKTGLKMGKVCEGGLNTVFVFPFRCLAGMTYY